MIGCPRCGCVEGCECPRSRDRMSWFDAPSNRVPPRECIGAARDSLNKAYSHPGISDGRHALGFIAEAVDWQRRIVLCELCSVSGQQKIAIGYPSDGLICEACGRACLGPELEEAAK